MSQGRSAIAAGLSVAVLALLSGCSGHHNNGRTAPAAALANAAASPGTAASRSATAPALTATPAAAGRLAGRQNASAGDWPVFDRDPQRSGTNADETTITAATVGGLQQLWSVALPEVADLAPILLAGAQMPDGST